jgi:GTP cyclohydrolase II
VFTYLDPNVRRRLIAQGKLRRINLQGNTLDPNVAPAEGEPAVNLLGPIPLPIHLSRVHTQVQWYASVRSTELTKVEELAGALRTQGGGKLFSLLASSMAVNSVLAVGEQSEWKNPLVRVHSSCLTGDVFGSERCECGPQLAGALERITNEPGGGLLVYMAGHEGRGIGLWAKAATYLLQDAGEDTYQANRSLGLPDDSRDFTDAAALLLHFVGNKPMRLLTNNPKKVQDLEKMGLTHITPVKHVLGVGERNRRYLDAKRLWGHQLDEDDLA